MRSSAEGAVKSETLVGATSVRVGDVDPATDAATEPTSIMMFVPHVTEAIHSIQMHKSVKIARLTG